MSFDIGLLFESKAFQVAPADQPFWYTSGEIGPYFINTHYLFGGEAVAGELLSFIDERAASVTDFIPALIERSEKVYEKSEIYRATIDSAVALLKPVSTKLSHVSGGQRRDWFFAPLIAKKLSLPALYIYNDLRMFHEDGSPVESLANASVLNAADLLRVGSSYAEKWVPAVQALGGELPAAFNVVDRDEGGRELLSSVGVLDAYSLIRIDAEFFADAFQRGLIDASQKEMLLAYAADPKESMRTFLEESPDFLKRASLSEDAKAQRCFAKLREKLPYGELSALEGL